MTDQERAAIEAAVRGIADRIARKFLAYCGWTDGSTDEPERSMLQADLIAELTPAIDAMLGAAFGCADCGTTLHKLHTGEHLCDLCLCQADIERHGVMPPGWQRPLTLREQLATRNARIADLEGLLKETLGRTMGFRNCVELRDRITAALASTQGETNDG